MAPGTGSQGVREKDEREKDEREKLARGGALSFIGSATSAALGFVLTIVISRFMGAEGAGIVFQATGVFAVVMAFAKFGMDSTVIYLIPRLRLDNPAAVRSALNACLIISLAAGLILVGGMELIAPLVWGDGQQELRATVQAVQLFVPVGAAFLIVSAALRALGSVREYVLVANIAVPALRPPAVMVAAVATGSVLVVTVAWAIPLALCVLVATFLVLRRLTDIEARQGGEVPRLPAKERWAQIWAFSVPRTIAAGLEQAIIWVDVLLIGWLMTDAAAGIYGGAARFIQAGLLVDAALRVIVSPRFSALLHQDKTTEARELYVTASAWLVLLATPAYLLLAFFPAVFLGLLGPEFTAGGPVLSILAVGMAVTFMAGNIHSMLIMSGRSGWAAINKVIVLIVNVVGNLLVIPQWGIAGAAVVWAVSTMLDAALALIQVRYFVGIKPAPWDVFRPMLIVAGSFGLPAVLARQFIPGDLAAVVVTIAAGGVLYAGACWYWRRALRIDGLKGMLVRR